jgi:hypothetical protein
MFAISRGADALPLALNPDVSNSHCRRWGRFGHAVRLRRHATAALAVTQAADNTFAKFAATVEKFDWYAFMSA